MIVWLVLQIELVLITLVALMFLHDLQEFAVVLAAAVIASAVLALIYRPWELG